MMAQDRASFPEQPPSGSGNRGEITKKCASCDCSITLGKKKVLIPLGLVLYANGKINLGPNPETQWLVHITDTSKRMIASEGCLDDPEKGLVEFIIKINCKDKTAKDAVLDSAEIEIQNNSGSTIFYEDLNDPKSTSTHNNYKDKRYLKQGVHEWKWDGYNNNNVFDTEFLKSDVLKVILTIKYNGCTSKCIKNISCKSVKKAWEWIDVKINRTQKTVDMIWRVNLNQIYNNKYTPDLVQLACDGVNKHYSTTITRYLSKNEEYKVITIAKNKTGKMMEKSFKMIFDEEGDETSNSFFREIFYNVKKGITSDNDELYKYYAAHELGHIILDNAYSKGISVAGKDFEASRDVSWGHKGTSTYTQDDITDQPLYNGGQADLIWYYEKLYDTVMKNSKAGIEDVRGAIWLAQVEFSDAR